MITVMLTMGFARQKSSKQLALVVSRRACKGGRSGHSKQQS